MDRAVVKPSGRCYVSSLVEPEEEQWRQDFELARACAAGDAAAQSKVKQRYDNDLVAMVRHMGADGPLTAEIIQQMWIHLLVPVPPNGARIGTYRGKGSLGGWLRVVATRMAIVALQARSAPIDPLDSTLDQMLASPIADPEVEYLKRLYSAEFRAAFRAAAAALTVRQRNLLRQYFVSQLSMEQVGALYGVHYATAYRHVQRAREALVAAIRAELGVRLRISEESVESILRLISSRIDLDLRSI